VISEGSCYTKDWSNDAENSALIKFYFTICSHRKQLYEIVIIFHNITVFTEINAAFPITYFINNLKNCNVQILCKVKKLCAVSINKQNC